LLTGLLIVPLTALLVRLHRAPANNQ